MGDWYSYWYFVSVPEKDDKIIRTLPRKYLYTKIFCLERRKFSLRFKGVKGLKNLIPLALKFRMPLVLLCLILNLSHFLGISTGTLVLVWSFWLFSLFFSFILALFFSHLLFFVFALTRSAFSVFMSCLIIIFYVLQKLCVVRANCLADVSILFIN